MANYERENVDYFCGLFIYKTKFWNFNPYSAGINFSRQNLTESDPLSYLI